MEEFAAGGVVEELGVGLFGDSGGCVSEEFADDFEAEAVVEEVAAEGAPQGVGADVGFVVAVLVLGQPGACGGRRVWQVQGRGRTFARWARRLTSRQAKLGRMGVPWRLLSSGTAGASRL